MLRFSDQRHRLVGVALCSWGAIVSACGSDPDSLPNGLPALAEPCGPVTLDERAPLDGGGGDVGAGASGAGKEVAEQAVLDDTFATDVAVAVHPNVNTLLVVTWSQARAAEEVWLEFTFEDGNVMRSRGAAGSLGAHRDVVLGVPGETDVTIQIVSRSEGVDYRSRDYSGRTRAVPMGTNG